MRAMIFATSFVLLSASTTFGQKAGDRIVVTSAKAQLKTLNEITGSIPKGNILTVEKVHGDWFWVAYSDLKATTQGWIKRSDVVSFEKSLDFFDAELRCTPTAELYAIRGTSWDEKDQHDKAIADYTESIRLDPRNAAVYHSRGYAWARKGEDEKAIADYSAAIRRDPTDAAVFYNRGNAWVRKGEYDKAIADYSESIRLDPEDGSTYGNRGRAWACIGEYEKALADYAEFNRLERQRPLAAIVFEGIRFVRTENLFKLLQSRTGRVLDPSEIKSDVRTLVVTRMFFEVTFRIDQSQQGPILVFRVVEKPAIQKITYIGNTAYDDKTLTDVTNLVVGMGYDVGANRELRRRIEDFYHENGFPNAKVSLEKGDSWDEWEVVFNIDEGAQAVATKVDMTCKPSAKTGQ